jgi:hypothetical protein
MLYEAIICNYIDESNRSVLILSNEPLCKNNININSIVNINRDYEYISELKAPKIIINSWTAEEHDELSNIKYLLNK